MGSFGASEYSLCFFIPFHPKPPPSHDRAPASLADAWRGVGLTYLLLKGLKRTSRALKLIGDAAEGHSMQHASDKGSWGSPASARPAPNPNYLEQFSPDELTEKSLKGFGLGLQGVMTTVRGVSQKAHTKSEVKEIFTVVKTADRVFEGVRVARGVIQTFASPVGDLVHTLGSGGNAALLGFKVVLKGVKISKGFITVTEWCMKQHSGPIGAAANIARRANKSRRFTAIVKGLKASEGAVNVVRITKEVGIFDKMDHLLSWSVLMKGFKLTKSAFRVLEPLSMIRTLGKGVLEIKGTVEGLSAVMKAVALSKELNVMVLKSVGFTKDAMAAFNRRATPEYSHRTEVSFKRFSSEKQPAITTQANKWEFIEHTKDVGVLLTTAEMLWYGEDNSPLPLSFLMLAGASCFSLEIPDQSGVGYFSFSVRT